MKKDSFFLTRWLNRFFIEGFGGMAYGLFATLIIGTIIKQIGDMVGGDIGYYISILGLMAQRITGAGIGVGVALKLGEDTYVILAAATAGMIGAYGSSIAAGTLVSDGVLSLSGPGEPLGAFIGAYAAIAVARLISGKTKLDLILTPAVGILAGGAVGIIIGPPISKFMTWLGALVNFATEQQPVLMGILVAVIMGMVLTLPISSAALGIILGLSGIAAGAATVGCCCQMIGFAVISYKDNGIGGFFAQGIGTSMLQVPNIFRKPLIWLPPIISSAILGPIAISPIVNLVNNATGSGMGTSGLVGPIMTYQTMIASESAVLVLIKIGLFEFILPAVVTLLVAILMRKMRLIHDGDMALSRQ